MSVRDEARDEYVRRSIGPSVGTIGDRLALAWDAGAEWERAHLAAQEPTEAEQAARFAVESKHHLYGTQCRCGFESHRARSRTEHIMTHYFDELSAARAARRDEETDQ